MMTPYEKLEEILNQVEEISGQFIAVGTAMVMIRRAYDLGRSAGRRERDAT